MIVALFAMNVKGCAINNGKNCHKNFEYFFV